MRALLILLLPFLLHGWELFRCMFYIFFVDGGTKDSSRTRKGEPFTKQPNGKRMCLTRTRKRQSKVLKSFSIHLSILILSII